MPYLYGASIHGIQNYLFETNRLREIAGASELVEELCSDFFKAFINPDVEVLVRVEVLLCAAGNIRLQAEEKKDLEKIVREFPLKVQGKAPGISLSQAVVEVENPDDPRPDFQRLEARLSIRKNMPNRPFGLTCIGMERYRPTGKPAGEERMDQGTFLKQNADREQAARRLIKKLDETAQSEDFPLEMQDIINPEKSKWLAVIHADGNNLGKALQKLASNVIKPSQFKDAYHKFSQLLNLVTGEAVKLAFEQIILPEKQANGKQEKYPFRPLIIGGDDFAAICRADLAIPFLQHFLYYFHRLTRNSLSNIKEIDKGSFEDGLTACAGIAFVKPSYPFHYAINLAEELCTVAKNRSKATNSLHVPSSILFHKVRSSYCDGFIDIIDRELSAKASDVRFDFGPYTVDDSTEFTTTKELLDTVTKLKRKDAPTNGLRRWLAELHENEASANQLLKRLKQIHPTYKNILDLAIVEQKTPIYDAMMVHSLERGQ